MRSQIGDDHEEIKVAIMHLKNNKAAGPDAELFKAGCNQYIYKIWLARKLLETQCPLSCSEKGRPFDMRQLQGYKPSSYRI